MIELKLKAAKREGTGKSVTRKLRAEKLVPAVAYGREKECINLSIDYKDLFKVLHSDGGEHAILNLEVDGDTPVKCVIKDIQRDPVTYEIVHVDFLLINMNKPIHINVPLELENAEIALGVKEGGLLEHVIREITIACLPVNIPEHLKVDVAKVELGGHLTIGDLNFENIEILNHHAGDVVVSVVVPRGTAAAANEEEAEESAE